MSVAKTLNKRILKLALPNILSNLTVPLLGLVDLTLSGHLEDAYAIGAVAISTTIFNLIYWNFSFLRMGTTGLTAQSHGAGDESAMGRNLAQSFLIAIIGGLLILLLQPPLLKVANSLLAPDDTIASYAGIYYNIVIWGAPAILCTYAFNGWLIGMQNTWYPMLVSIVTNMTNIAVSASLVLIGGKGIAGIAIGTFVAQWTGALMLVSGIYFLYVRSKKVSLPQKILELKVGLRKYFDTNIHIFLRTILLAVISAFFTYSGTKQGALILAANALLYQFFTFFSYFIDGFAFAGEAIVGHFFGMKERRMLNKSIRILMIWGISLAILTSLVYLFIAEPFLTFLTDKVEVIEVARHYLMWVYLIPIMGFLAFLFDGIFVGITATREMFVSMLVAVAVFFTLNFLLPIQDANHLLWASFISYLFVRGIYQIIISSRLRGLGLPFEYLYYLSIGSTLLDSEKTIRTHISDIFNKVEFSKFYITDDVSYNSSKKYLNCVSKVVSPLSTSEMIAITKQIETNAGRNKNIEQKDVVLDVDVVVKDSEVLRPKDYNRDYFQVGYNEIKRNE